MARRPWPAIVLALLGLCSGMTGIARAQDAEPVLIQLEMGRLASRTVSALRRDTDVLIPLGEFFDLAEVRHEEPLPGVIEAVLQPGNIRLRIDSRSDTITAG